MLTILDEDSSLRILVDPQLRMMVERDDWLCLDALLKDFRERARTDPYALFEQLSSLNVGPLVTEIVGIRISDHPTLANRTVGLVPYS